MLAGNGRQLKPRGELACAPVMPDNVDPHPAASQ